MEPKDLSLNDINIGDTVSFIRVFTEKDVKDFTKLSGDENPLHTDENYASKTKFGQKLVHGMLVGSLCSDPSRHVYAREKMPVSGSDTIFQKSCFYK